MGMGCVDEHDCLAPDEVLVNDGRGWSEASLVLVGRSPAYHPGDLRVLSAVPKPQALIDAGVSRRGAVMFSTRGSRPVFDTMGQGDVDGDKYYVLTHQQLFEALVGSTQGQAHDYASQAFERPKHRPQPFAPTPGHADADLRGAFAMLERLTDRRRGGGLLALGAIVKEWMVACDKLGATSTRALNLTERALEAHGVRSLRPEQLSAFEEKWTRMCRAMPQRPEYLGGGAQHTSRPPPTSAAAVSLAGAGAGAAAKDDGSGASESNSVVGALDVLNKRAIALLDQAVQQLREGGANIDAVSRSLRKSLEGLGQTEGMRVSNAQLEIQRALARSQEDIESQAPELSNALRARLGKDEEFAERLDMQMNGPSGFLAAKIGIDLQTASAVEKKGRRQELRRELEQLEAAADDDQARTGPLDRAALRLMVAIGKIAEAELCFNFDMKRQLGRAGVRTSGGGVARAMAMATESLPEGFFGDTTLICGRPGGGQPARLPHEFCSKGCARRLDRGEPEPQGADSCSVIDGDMLTAKRMRNE